MSDFQSRARAAAASISSMNPAEAFAQSLLNDRPTIDSAVKAYTSLTAARSLSASDPNIISSTGITVGGDNGKTSLHRAIRNSQGDVDGNGAPLEKCFFATSKNPQQSSLLCARALLKAINNFQIPRDATPSAPQQNKGEEKETEASVIETKDEERRKADDLEFQVVKIVWNGLVDNKEKKPSRFLGRKSLHLIYHLIVASFLIENDANNSTIPVGVDKNEMLCFFKEFGSLLHSATKRKDGCNIHKTNKDAMNEQDDDSCLLWDTDGGEEELQRRRDRREKKAKTAKMRLTENQDVCNSTQGLTIEEIPEGEEDEQ